MFGKSFSRLARRISVLGSCALLAGVLPAAAQAAFEGDGPEWVQGVDEGAGGQPVPEPDSGDASEQRHYFVILDGQPLATYRGGIANLPATAADANGRLRPDLDSPAARRYLDHLEAERNRAIDTLRNIEPAAEIGWRYRYALHGFSAEMRPDSAVAMAARPGVRMVFPAEELVPEMDSTAGVINTPAIWDYAGGISEAGIGARIAILDSGSAVGHPWFDDTGMPDPPEGYPSVKMIGRDGTELEYPEPERFTNGKIIAGRVFVSSANEAMLSSTTPHACSTGGCSDHGVHVAGIASGRFGSYSYDLGSRTIDIEMAGVAPMAHVLAYKNVSSTPGMAAAIEYMIEDEVDVFNASLGHAGWLLDRPEHHPIALAIDAAADAGVVAVVSAGNSGGNGPTSLSGGWKYSDRLLAVGNTSTSGSFDQAVQVTGTDVPEAARNLIAAPRGTTDIPAPITAQLYWAGDGCTVDEAADGKIAVVLRFMASGAAFGSCSYLARATNMRDSGALAIIYYYEDRVLGIASPTSLDLPSVALGITGGSELVAWLRDGGEGSATIAPTSAVVRAASDLPDFLSSSSSRGPSIDWGVKPDISAPGSGILSSRVSGNINEQVYSIGGLSGTSMSAPHVAGAAAMLRSIHPEWTADEVRAVLMTTASPSVRLDPLDPRSASVGEGGPGRLDLTYAADPGAFVHPPALTFGRVDVGASKTLTATLRSASLEDETWTLEPPEPTPGGPTVSVEPAEIELMAGASAVYSITLSTEDATETPYDGRVRLTRGEGPQVLRQAFQTYVDQPEQRRDVLVIDWAYGRTPDYTPAYTEALEALGLTYTVWVMDEEHPDRKSTHPPYSEMYRHNLVILNGNMSDVSLQEALSGQFQYQNYLLGGGNMLIAGQGTQDWWRYLGGSPLADTPTNRSNYPDTFPYRWYGVSQNQGCEMCLARYFAGFTPQITATLSGRLLVPYPTKADRPEREVVLEPHPEADGPFQYPIDISTGALAPEGAEGNQYLFASGDVLGDYIPSTSSTISSRLGDISYAETMLGRIAQEARPLWAYTGDFATEEGATEELTKVVGTYVAGKHDPEAEIAWNAMFWGFGLEGVGEGAEGSPSRERLLGDTFNFMALNLFDVGVERAAEADSGSMSAVRLAPPSVAKPVMIASATVDWGDGTEPEPVSFDPPVAMSEAIFSHQYEASGEYDIGMSVMPAGGAAPFEADGTVEIEVRSPVIYLPWAVSQYSLGEPVEVPAARSELEAVGRAGRAE